MSDAGEPENEDEVEPKPFRGADGRRVHWGKAPVTRRSALRLLPAVCSKTHVYEPEVAGCIQVVPDRMPAKVEVERVLRKSKKRLEHQCGRLRAREVRELVDVAKRLRSAALDFYEPDTSIDVKLQSIQPVKWCMSRIQELHRTIDARERSTI